MTAWTTRDPSEMHDFTTHDFLLALMRPAWMDQGNCTDTTTNLFFPRRGQSTKEAKAVCVGCPVQETCLEYAIENGEKFGIWGGKSERERRRMRNQRRAQQPSVPRPIPVRQPRPDRCLRCETPIEQHARGAVRLYCSTRCSRAHYRLHGAQTA